MGGFCSAKGNRTPRVSSPLVPSFSSNRLEKKGVVATKARLSKHCCNRNIMETGPLSSVFVCDAGRDRGVAYHPSVVLTFFFVPLPPLRFNPDSSFV